MTDEIAPRHRGPWPVWVGVTAVLALLAGLVVYVIARPADTGNATATRPRPPAVGLTVTLSRPGAGTARVSIGFSVPLDISVVADAPVRAFEVWVDATRVGGSAIDAPSTDVRRRVAWVPQQLGPVVVTARAVDDTGRVAASNPLRVAVAEWAQPRVWAQVTAVAGDTMTSIAARSKLKPAQLAAANPRVAVQGALLPGTTLDVPVTDAAGVPLPTTEDLAAAAANSAGLTGPGSSSGSASLQAALNGITLRPDIGLGSLKIEPPSAAGSVDGCQARLSVTGPAGATSFLISELTPTSSVFATIGEVIGSVAGSGTTAQWSGAIGAGDHWFVVSAKGTGGAMPGAPVRLTVPEACTGTWTGAVRLVNGQLTGGDVPTASLGFTFLSTDAAHWVRVPEADGSAVAHTGEGFDLTPYLPRIDGHHLFVQAWGWKDAQFVPLGDGEFTPGAGMSLADEIGSPQGVTLDWVQRRADNGGAEHLAREGQLTNPGVETLRWSTTGEGVTHAIWQVTTTRPAATPDLHPAGLIAQGTLDPSQTEFPLDLAALAATRRSIALEQLRPGYSALLAGSAGLSTAGATTTGPTTTSPSPSSPGGGAAPRPASGTSSDLLPPTTDLWIRVLPMVGDQPLGRVSNLVHFDVRPASTQPQAKPGQAPPPTDAPFLASLHLLPPTAPEPALANCWKFDGWDTSKLDQGAFDVAKKYEASYDFMSAIHEGGVNAFTYLFMLRLIDVYGNEVPICAACYPGVGALGGTSCDTDSNFLEDFGSALVSGITWLWDNVVVGTFNYLKDTIVDLVVKLSGCEAIVGAIDDSLTKYCSVVARVALDAVLVAYGIPPNLPTTGELINAAKGDLASLAAELAKSVGVPCDEMADAQQVSGKPVGCEALASQLIDQLPSLLDDYYRQAAATSSGIVFPPGMRVSPHPRGQGTPPRVDVLVVPNPARPSPAYGECSVRFEVDSTWQTGPAEEGTGRATVDIPGGPVFDGPDLIRRIEVTPQSFSGSAFLPVTRNVVVNPEGSALTSVYLYEPAPLEAVPVVYRTKPIGIFGGGGGFGFNVDLDSGLLEKSSSLPGVLFLLHAGAVHHASLASSCVGPVTADVDTGLSGPQG